MKGRKKIIFFGFNSGFTLCTHPPEQYLVHGPVPEEESVVEEAVLYPERVAESLGGHLAEDGADDNVLGREAAAWNVCLEHVQKEAEGGLGRGSRKKTLFRLNTNKEIIALL